MLDQAFEDVSAQLGLLRIALVEFQGAVADNSALSGGSGELLLLLAEAMRAADRARQASRGRVAIDVVRRTLPRCQRPFNQLMGRFRTELDSAERVKEFEEARRGQVRYALGRCRIPLFAASRALSVCWVEMARYAEVNPGGALPFDRA